MKYLHFNPETERELFSKWEDLFSQQFSEFGALFFKTYLINLNTAWFQKGRFLKLDLMYCFVRYFLGRFYGYGINLYWILIAVRCKELKISGLYIFSQIFAKDGRFSFPRSNSNQFGSLAVYIVFSICLLVMTPIVTHMKDEVLNHASFVFPFYIFCYDHQ